MDSQLFGKSFDYAKKKRKWVLILGALGFTCYGAQRIYTLPCLVKKRQRLFKLFGAFVSLAEMVSDSSHAIGILSKDLKEFLLSDSDQIPQSFKQLSKMAKSTEFSDSLTMTTRAFAIGILRGYHHDSIKSDRSLTDKVIDKLLTDAGSCFASLIVGSFARNLVMGFIVNVDSKLDQWFEVACEDKCREVVGEFIRVFVSTAVAVYLDKTMNINAYDEFFSGLTNPKHEGKVRDMLVSVCSGAVEAGIRTTYRVWSNDSNGSMLIPSTLQIKKVSDENRESGLKRNMLSTLTVASNMKFVVDLAFETVIAFLKFLLEKLCVCVKRSVDVVREEVVDRGVEAMRCVSGKSCGVTTVCLTLCLNIVNSPWILASYY